MNKLSNEEIEFITKCLKEGKPLPDNYRYAIPFETRKEYELTYDSKEREEDILADIMAVPLQPVKTFGDGNGGWTNKLIFGDNCQVLKALMDNPEVYDKSEKCSFESILLMRLNDGGEKRVTGNRKRSFSFDFDQCIWYI